eukprot:1149267-Pelagomonas_calceolata.AAC.6
MSHGLLKLSTKRTHIISLGTARWTGCKFVTKVQEKMNDEIGKRYALLLFASPPSFFFRCRNIVEYNCHQMGR